MKARTVILAAGDFPRKGGLARRLLEEARHVVCCDRAGDAFRRRIGREPDAIVGDLDSLRLTHPGCAVVRVAEQETNDLDKALAYCRQRGWKRPVVVGATGRREDHTLGNVFRALAANVEIVTDFGLFVPVEGAARLKVGKGTAISIFAPDSATRMTSRGLAWPLDGVRFETLFYATLNRATRETVTLTATRRVTVFIAL